MKSCFSCGQKPPSPPKAKTPSPPLLKLPPQAVSVLANYLNKGKRVRAVSELFPKSYAPYIRMRTPPRTTRTNLLYRAKRKAGIRFYPSNKKHLLNTVLPIAYKRNNWTHYAFSPPGPIVQFFNANGTRFTITKKGTRKGPNRRFVTIPGLRKQRKPGNTWENYVKRASRYERYIKGAQTRRNILNFIQQNIEGGALSMYKPNNNHEIPNKWIRSGLYEKHPTLNKYRVTKKGLLFYLVKKHPDPYRKVPGYGITRVANPSKLSKRNIIENLNRIYNFNGQLVRNYNKHH